MPFLWATLPLSFSRKERGSFEPPYPEGNGLTVFFFPGVFAPQWKKATQGPRNTRLCDPGTVLVQSLFLKALAICGFGKN